MAEVKVNLTDHSYSIHIEAGIISQVGQLLKDRPLSRKTLIVTDRNVDLLYADAIAGSLTTAGFTPAVFVVEPGEDSKSLATAEKIFSKAIHMGLDRKSPIIALGGGVVGDLAGFIAATYMRGVPFIQVPTTLLAQVDSSVGGKTAVNHPLGKNLIGAFYQPQLVVIDPLVLNTLPDRELKAGLAEVVKYGTIADSEFFAYLACHVGAVLAREPAVLTEVISRCCRIKAEVVAKDEREESLRMILNFGHTIGHAVEGVGGYSQYNHGEGVAIGMHGAALLSHSLNVCSQSTVTVLTRLITAMGLPLTAPGYGTDELLTFLARDKKVIDSKVKWVLIEDIGRVSISQDVPEEHVRGVLSQLAGKQSDNAGAAKP